MAHSLLQNLHTHLSDLEELTWAHGKHKLHVEQTWAVSFPLFARTHAQINSRKSAVYSALQKRHVTTKRLKFCTDKVTFSGSPHHVLPVGTKDGG